MSALPSSRTCATGGSVADCPTLALPTVPSEPPVGTADGAHQDRQQVCPRSVEDDSREDLGLVAATEVAVKAAV